MWTEVYELAELLKSGQSTWEDLDLDDVDVRLKVRESDEQSFFWSFSHPLLSVSFPSSFLLFRCHSPTQQQWIGLFHRRKRTPGKFMMRVRVPNGDLTAEQLRALGQTIAPYGDDVGCADVTTRAGVQLRGITLDDAGRVLDVLKAAGITPIQSGMDNVRQVSSRRGWRERERESLSSCLKKKTATSLSFFFLFSSLCPPSLLRTTFSFPRSRDPPSPASTPWSSATRAPLRTPSTT